MQTTISSNVCGGALIVLWARLWRIAVLLFLARLVLVEKGAPPSPTSSLKHCGSLHPCSVVVGGVGAPIFLCGLAIFDKRRYLQVHNISAALFFVCALASALFHIAGYGTVLVDQKGNLPPVWGVFLHTVEKMLVGGRASF